MINIQISSNEQIGAIIIQIRNNLIDRDEYSLEKHRLLVIEALKERSFDEEIIKEWVLNIE
jgi:hypothetical protein